MKMIIVVDDDEEAYNAWLAEQPTFGSSLAPATDMAEAAPENKDTDEDVSEEPTEGDTPDGEGEAEADEAEGETATL